MPETKLAKKSKLAKRKNGYIRGGTQFFRTARYGLTLQEHRLIYYVLMIGQQEGKPFEPVDIRIKDFREQLELKGEGTYTDVRRLSEKVLQRVVEVYYKDKDGEHIKQAQWLSDITYHEKNGTVTVVPNKSLQPFFEGKQYSNMEYKFLVQFTSQYAERLYELLKSMSFKSLVDFEIEDLREKLKVGKKYQNYAHLKQYALSPAVEDINKYTDISVDFREQRGACNKVETVVFSVTIKSDEIQGQLHF